MSYLFEDNIIKTNDIKFNDDLGGIGTVFFKCMKNFSNRVAQVQAESGKNDTYESLLKKCICAAIFLKQKGVKEGDMVCLCSDLCLDSCVPLIAAYFVGAVTYCLEPTLPVSESVNIVKLLPPKIIFVSKNAEDLIKDVLKKSEVSSEYITFGMEFQKLLNGYDNSAIDDFKPEYIIDSSKTYCIYFSSGSTGVPKAILLNNYYTFLSAPPVSGVWNRNGLHLAGIENPVILCYSNWHWVSSINILVLSITTGACRVLCKNFDGKEAWGILNKYNVTNVFLSPYQCIELYFNKPVNPSLPTLKELVTGGSTLSKDYMIYLSNLLNPAIVRAEYGLTEVGYITNFDPSNKEHRKLIKECPDSVGCPVDGVWYKVVNTETGEILGPNQIGELRLKLLNSKGYMNGYYKMDSTECFDKEGWFKTDDIVYYDKNMCFYIVDRIKARIIYKDWLIYPSVVEKILIQHSSVKNAVVIGIPHKEDGEHLMGIVILNEASLKEKINSPHFKIKNKELLLNNIRQFVDEHVEHYQRLGNGIRIVKSFPLTASGKVNRLKIKQMILENQIF